MSPSGATAKRSGRRGGYRAPRERREVVTAILVATLIVVVTASLVWFLRPNRESESTPTPAPFPTAPVASSTPAPSPPEPTNPTDTTPPADGSGAGSTP